MMWKILMAQIKEEIYDSLTSCRLFPEEQKGSRMWTKGIEELLYINQHILNESKTRRKNLSMALTDYKKSIWYSTSKLDNKLPQNVQDIRWSHEHYRENHENLESRIDSKREKLGWSEDPKGYIPGRCTITITICNSDDATQPHTQEMHRGIQS